MINNYSLSVFTELNMPDEEYVWFKEEFERLTSIQLSCYKEKQMRRRINTLIARRGLDSYEAYMSRLKRDPRELAYFLEYITINVTEFFRTPEHWRNMEAKALLPLSEQFQGALKL